MFYECRASSSHAELDGVKRTKSMTNISRHCRFLTQYSHYKPYEGRNEIIALKIKDFRAIISFRPSQGRLSNGKKNLSYFCTAKFKKRKIPMSERHISTNIQQGLVNYQKRTDLPDRQRCLTTGFYVRFNPVETQLFD